MIPTAQLEMWSRQGVITHAKNTYTSITAVIDDNDSPYYKKTFDASLFGAYSRNTNIFQETPVNLALRLDSTWYHDAETLPADQYEEFKTAYPAPQTYGLDVFQTEVAAWLLESFDGVQVASNTIFVPGSGTRRDCMITTCARFRYYFSFSSDIDQHFAEGVCFFLDDGTRVIRFPQQHADSCRTKEKSTGQWFNPTVRVYKNIRNWLISKGRIDESIAPSYFVESLLWNVPKERFGASLTDTVPATIDYLLTADLSLFKCANGFYRLLGSDPYNSWNPQDCQTFLEALHYTWNRWNTLPH